MTYGLIDHLYPTRDRMFFTPLYFPLSAFRRSWLFPAYDQLNLSADPHRRISR